MISFQKKKGEEKISNKGETKTIKTANTTKDEDRTKKSWELYKTHVKKDKDIEENEKKIKSEKGRELDQIGNEIQNAKQSVAKYSN